MSHSHESSNNTQELIRKFLKNYDIRPLIEKHLSKQCSPIIYREKTEVSMSDWEKQCNRN